MHICPATTIQLIITPAENPKANLNITWTELEILLYKALPEVKSLHIVCSKPERLVRLWMLPEAGLVGVGQSHFFEDFFFGSEGVASDRAYWETFHPSLVASTSAATLEELALGSPAPVTTWQLADEAILEGFGPEAIIKTTKAFKLVGQEEEEETEVEGWEELGPVEAGNKGAELTEEAIAKFLQETEWQPKSFTPSSVYSGDAELYYDGELWLTKA
jgi:hypothetical protein